MLITMNNYVQNLNLLTIKFVDTYKIENLKQ